jgi:hypothetical protein
MSARTAELAPPTLICLQRPPTRTVAPAPVTRTFRLPARHLTDTSTPASLITIVPLGRVELAASAGDAASSASASEAGMRERGMSPSFGVRASGSREHARGKDRYASPPMGRRGIVSCALCVVFASSAATADATVLISAPAPFTKDCGARIEVGVWLREDGQPSARRVTIAIRKRSGALLWRKRVRATTEWRYWHYRPRCGARYVVTYRNAIFGVDRFNVRVRR